MFRLLSCVLFAALCIPATGIAQAGKIVWLNVDTAVLSCDEGKNEFGIIQRYVDDKNAEMGEMRKEYESLSNQLNVQGSKLTDEARADLEFQINQKESQLQRFQQDTKQEIGFKRDRAFSYILKRMQPIIEKAAKEKGYGAVMVLNPSRDAYVDPTLDITDELVKAYNATYPASPASPAKPAKPAAPEAQP